MDTIPLLVSALAARPLAISTLRRTDLSGTGRLKDAEYFKWGVGPALGPGAIIAIYVPKGTEGAEKHWLGTIPFVFSVARRAEPRTPPSVARHSVWLHQRTVLPTPLSLDLLKTHPQLREWRLPHTNFRAVGSLRAPLTQETRQAFWHVLLELNPELSGDLKRNQLGVADFSYDLALSFAGEDRAVAREIASNLLARNFRVFFDENEQAVLLGKDLYQHLHDIYQNRAKYCAIIISESYAAKLWTKHELRAAQARAFVQSEEYILPLRLDETQIPGIGTTIGYLDIRSLGLTKIIDILVSKLNGKT
jgi:hypothetical protein